MDPGYQDAYVSVRLRVSSMISNRKWADCSFLVGTEPNQQIFHAHKLILTMSSPVFERMFYDALADATTDRIVVPDVKPEAFRSMLVYIYCDRLYNTNSIDDLSDLMYVAEKYQLTALVSQCSSYLCTKLVPGNACRLYEIGKLYNHKLLFDSAMKIIIYHTKEVLKHPSFLDIKLSTLVEIFDQKKLQIDSELELCNALQAYLDANFPLEPDTVLMAERRAPTREELHERQRLEATQVSTFIEAVREKDVLILRQTNPDHVLIREAVKRIRFLTLTANQFMGGPGLSFYIERRTTLLILIHITTQPTEILHHPLPEGISSSRFPRFPVLNLPYHYTFPLLANSFHDRNEIEGAYLTERLEHMMTDRQLYSNAVPPS